MAALMCMSNDGHEATFVGTFFPSGDSVRLCDECMPPFCAVVFERMTGVDMAPALFMASDEGQAALLEAEGHPEEVAAPPDMEPKGNTGPEAPGPAPADPDDQPDPTGGGASLPAKPGARTRARASSTTVSSEGEPPGSEQETAEAAT